LLVLVIENLTGEPFVKRIEDEYEHDDENEPKDELRVHEEINSQFWVLRRPAGKTRKHRNIKHISSFRNAAGRDGSTSKM